MMSNFVNIFKSALGVRTDPCALDCLPYRPYLTVRQLGILSNVLILYSLIIVKFR